MKKKLIYFCIVIILVESILIFAFIFQKLFFTEFAIKVDSNKNTFTISNDNLWLYIHLADDGSLRNVFINDGIDREVNLNYSDLGIVNYKITDKSCGYEVESYFDDNFMIEEKDIIVSDMIKDGLEDGLEIVNIRPHSIFRIEKYNNMEKKYTIDYTTEPYFFEE
jgi:hypothetical protein